MNFAFKGKIRYRPCRMPVFPPSDWSGSLVERSFQKPRAGLRLEFVYGCSTHESMASNVAFNDDGKIVYFTAALGIVYDATAHMQAFFNGHCDNIKCLCMNPTRRSAAPACAPLSCQCQVKCVSC
jgi:HELP motif